MPRFYFHILDGRGRIEDPEGSELADADAARFEALDSARQLWAAAIVSRQDLSAHRFEISDERGEIVGTIRFVEALPFARPPG